MQELQGLLLRRTKLAEVELNVMGVIYAEIASGCYSCGVIRVIFCSPVTEKDLQGLVAKDMCILWLSLLIAEFVRCKNSKAGLRNLLLNFVENDQIYYFLEMKRLAAWSNYYLTNLVTEVVQLIEMMMALAHEVAKEKNFLYIFLKNSTCS